MTNADVQRIESAVANQAKTIRDLTVQVAILAERVDAVPTLQEDIKSLQEWRERAKGVAWAFGLLWAVGGGVFAALVYLTGAH